MKARLSYLLLSWAFLLIADAMAAAAPVADMVLRDHWLIQSSANITNGGDIISRPGYAARDWYPMTAPSTVLAALVANQAYADPYYGNNYFELPGVRRWDKPEGNPFETSWWYRTEFDLPADCEGKHVFLHFHGVNYRANLWVNGQKAVDASELEGAYRLFSFDIARFAKAGQSNCLALEIIPPRGFDLSISWVDWNPTPPDRGLGIWYDVTLSATGPVAIEHPFVKTKLNLPATDQARLTVVAELKNAESKPVKGRLKGILEDREFSQEVELAANETKEVTFAPGEYSELVMAHPRLWWPHTVGPQNLYDLKLSFETGGAISDTRRLRFGVREISAWMNEFDQQRTKVFQVNGRNLVIRGGGYVEDLMLRPSNERVDAELRYLKFMNLNALRMEAPRGSDYLFQRCDEEGILIMVGWCCGYPFESWKNWTPHLADIAEQSWRDQILNLRAHPSVFTWLYGSDNFPPEDMERRYINVLKQYDDTRPYSSSATQAPSKVAGYTGLVMGPWPEVYGYLPPTSWYDKLEFNTEAGPNGEQLPPIETIKRVMPERDLWPPGSAWDLRRRKDFYPLAHQALESRYGKPVTLEDDCAKSQVLQLEAVRAMFEAFAANKYKSSGVIYWMFNSAWPKFYWQLFDNFLMPNGAFYGAKLACEPLHVQYNYKENAVQLVNSFYQDFAGLKVSAQVYDFQAREIFSKAITTDLKSDESKILFKLDLREKPTPVFFVKLLLQDRTGKELSSNFYWLSNQGDEKADFTGLAKLPVVEVIAKPGTIRQENGRLELAISFSNASPSLAFALNPKLLFADTREPVLPVFWEDNYFSLLPGESRSVAVSVEAAQAAGKKLLFKLDGWNLRAAQEQELSPAVAAVGAPAKIKLLILEGVSNHDWQHRLALVREILARDGSFAVEVSTSPSAPDDPAWSTWRPDFSKYDVVLSGYNNLGGKAQWPREVQQAFEKYVRDGGGFYVYHEANNSFAEWPEYNQMIGLGWRKKDFGNAIIVRPDESLQMIPPGEGDDTWHGNRSDVVVHQLGDHPIHAGLPRAWKAAEIEVYCYARGPATNLTVLAYAADAKTRLQFPIEWTVQYGQGRVFVSTYGHVWADQKDPRGMRCAAFQTIMLRALKWLAKRPVEEIAPADFPTADAVSVR